MVEEFAIQQILNTYSEGASRADWEQVVSTFVADRVWEIPAFAARFEGLDAIREGLATLSAQMAYIVQINAPAIIKVSGDSASARSVIRECGKLSDRDEALEVLGFNEDRLVKAPDGWKFLSRSFEIQGLHNFPLMPQAPR